MSHQFSLFTTPEDVADLETRLRELGPVAILHSRSPTASARTLPSMQHLEGGRRWHFYYVARLPDLGDVRTSFVPAQNYWAIDWLESPVIEFTLSYCDHAIIRRGRLFYTAEFYGDTGQPKRKTAAFSAWANSVFKLVKRSLTREGDAYVGKGARAAVLAGTARYAD